MKATRTEEPAMSLDPAIKTTVCRQSPGIRRLQVYSNRPLQAYGYIVPLEDGTFGIQMGDPYTAAPVGGPLDAQGFKSKAAAHRAIRDRA